MQTETPLSIEICAGTFSIHRLGASDPPPDLDGCAGFHCRIRTGAALTVVCASTHPVAATESSHGWGMLRVRGPLDFALTGVLAGISQTLAQAEIPLFAISCWETDYILVRAMHREPACAALRSAGYRVTAARH